MIVTAQTKRKEPVLNADRWEVVHTVELPWPEFFHFKNHLLHDYPFIAEHSGDLHVDSNGNTRGLLVLCEGSEDGILVNSEGSSYARYSAFLPKARTIMMMERYPSLKKYCQQMGTIADQLVQKALGEQEDGECIISLDEAGVSRDQRQMLVDMLSERPEIQSVTPGESGVIEVSFAEPYCQTNAPEQTM